MPDPEQDDRLKLINLELSSILQTYPYPSNAIVEAARYCVLSPGHRWRPILFLTIYEKLTGQKADPGVVGLACSIELLHSATILLDDLPSIDNATLRRGQQPCHLRFGEPRAILTACWLCNVTQHVIHKFIETAATKPSEDLENVVRSVETKLIEGELQDIQKGPLTEEEIVQLCAFKSGALYSFAAAAPAWILRADRLAANLANFGNSLGISYQISDDIADLSETVESLGKDVGKDVYKNTIPRRFGVQRAEQLREVYFQRAIAELQECSFPAEDLRNIARKIIFG